MAGSTPAVSVVICMLNAAGTISESISSILNQSFTDFELILYDDASTDTTVAIAKTFDDPRIRIVQGTANRGPGGAAVQAISTAKGNYIARIDADDLALPERLECQMKYFSRHPETWLLGTGFLRFRGSAPAVEFSSHDTADIVSFSDLLKRNALCHSSVMFSRKVLDAGIQYRKEFRLAEDYDLFLRVALKGEVAVLHRCLCLHRHSPTSLSFREAGAMRRNIEIVKSLAVKRKNTGADTLEEAGVLPTLTREQEEEVCIGTVYTLLDTARESFREGYSLSAGRLLLRAIGFSPLRTFRAILGMMKAGS